MIWVVIEVRLPAAAEFRPLSVATSNRSSSVKPSSETRIDISAAVDVEASSVPVVVSQVLISATVPRTWRVASAAVTATVISRLATQPAGASSGPSTRGSSSAPGERRTLAGVFSASGEVDITVPASSWTVIWRTMVPAIDEV